MKKTEAAKRHLAKVTVLYPEDTFMVNRSLILRINICGKNTAHSKFTNR